MTGALVSGQDRVAVFLEGSQAWCVSPQSPSPKPVSLGLLPYLLADIEGASCHPEATPASAGALLEKACREERGLHMALISMDPASSETTRELAEDALEEFLEHSHVLEFIENRLFSNPLPESALWHRGFVSGEVQAYPKVGLLRRSVLGAQESIARVRGAWEALPEDLFAEPDDRVDFESVLVETGAFRVLAMAAAEAPEKHGKGSARMRLLSDRRYLTFANSRNILVEWTRGIPNSSQGDHVTLEECEGDESDRRRENQEGGHTWNRRRDEEPSGPYTPPGPSVGLTAPVVTGSSEPKKEATTVSSTPTNRPESDARGRAGSATIGKAVKIVGQIYSKEDLHVDGDLEGMVEALEHRVTIGSNGSVHAGIKAREVVAFGTIWGNVEATEKIEIRKDAKLVGDIKTARIIIEDGAYFKGSIDIVKPEPAKVSKPKQQPAPAPAPSHAPASAGALDLRGIAK